MNPKQLSAGVLPAPNTEVTTASLALWSTVMPTLNGVMKMHLLHEALSRARMRSPQAGRSTTSTEATRSARTVALEAHRRAAREVGLP